MASAHRFRFVAWILLCIAPFAAGCASAPSTQPGTVTFVIESMPGSLDPRIGTDAQSENLQGLLFSSLVQRDAQRNIEPDLAEKWEAPDPLTYVFHLRSGVRFHDGRALTSADVKFTFDTVLSGAVPSPLRGGFRMVRMVDAPNPQTVIFHLSEPSTSFLENVARPAMGIIPAGSPADFAARPIGSGPFRFVSARQDESVVIERNPDYFGAAPNVQRVILRIVPDAIVRALELRKGSADIEMSSLLTSDVVSVLGKDPSISVADEPGTHCAYIAVNFNDPALAHREVRQALQYATDRESIIRYLLHGQARVADGVLPPNSWAYEPNVMHYGYDPALAEKLLDQAGFPRRPELGGMRLHVVLKSSTEEATRLLGEVLQNQWRRVGIDLELRSLETATLLADISRGNFQLYTLRWVGGNNDPDIFDFIFNSKRMPPNGANRGHYKNSRVDELLDAARAEQDMQKRRELFQEVQRITALDLPYINLWFTDNICVHRKRVQNVALEPTGSYNFLTSITLQ